MTIFLDTGDIKQIEQFLDMGLIRGVTTNPSILVKCGIKGGNEAIKKCTIDIAELIDPYPLSVEVTTNDYEGMISQAVEYAGWADNINVKITIHGPDGELDNLKAINMLENRHDIRINATAMMSAQQCLMASLAGATYVSLFGGRVNNMGYNCCEEIMKTRDLIDSHSLNSKLIIGSIREGLNVVEWLNAGADIITVTPDILKGIIVHPYSKETVRMFLDDAKKL
ncbi:MAG: hypothetical protein JW931_02640 [Methanomicrobiaceae archaeon]|nr:hypothetical protein [Methanomicrobiaceae archaeon]